MEEYEIYDGVDDYIPFKCPKCGSSDFTVGLFSLTCNKCGHTIFFNIMIRVYNYALSESEIKETYKKQIEAYRKIGIKV